MRYTNRCNEDRPSLNKIQEREIDSMNSQPRRNMRIAVFHQWNWRDSTQDFVNTLKEQKSEKSGNLSPAVFSISDMQGWALNVNRWASYFKHSCLCLRNNDISLHACCRHYWSARHGSNAQTQCIILCSKGFNILEEKNKASKPYSITDLNNDLYIVSSGPLSAF